MVVINKINETKRLYIVITIIVHVLSKTKLLRHCNLLSPVVIIASEISDLPTKAGWQQARTERGTERGTISLRV
jgi:hypothetical protein